MQTKKIIGINTLFLIPNKVGGTEYYARSVLHELSMRDKKNVYVIFCNNENFDTFHFENKNWKKVRCAIFASNRFLRVLYEQVVLPFHVWKNNCQILHSFGYFGPIVSTARLITTIHDANWKDHPQDQPLISRFLLNLLMSATVARSEHILTDSSFSKQRLAYYYPQHTHKMQVMEPGLNDLFLTLLQKKQKLPIEKHPFLLCVSGLYPHKRVSYLLSLWPALQKHFPSHQLIIVGNNGGEASQIAKRSKRLSGVRLLKKVSLPSLVALYQNADLFLFPSVYEGFGYPVYEALAAGLPTLVGKKDCYSEGIQPELAEFSFNRQHDVASILSMIKKRKKPLIYHGYENLASKLLSLYKKV